MKAITVTNKQIAYAMGVGLALFPIHNFNQPGMTWTPVGWRVVVFIPQLGAAIVICCIALVLNSNIGAIRKNIGSKHIWIPMLVIAGSMLGQLIMNPEMKTLATALFGLCLVGVYLTSRILGKEITYAFIPFIIVQSISCMVQGVMRPGVMTSGIVSSYGNHCIATGYMVFAVVMLSGWKYQWLLAILAVVGLFFTGSPEAIFVLGVLSIVLLVRKDYSRLTLIAAGIVVSLAIAWIATGNAESLYGYAFKRMGTAKMAVATQSEEVFNASVTNRWIVIKQAMSEIRPLGYGLSITEFNFWTVHNLPLIIVQQLGIAAAVAWTWVTVYCLKTTTWKFAWIAVIALCVFDHYVWTQMAFWWWVLVGVSTTIPIRDYVFRKELAYEYSS